jgi:hypothetical protein
MVVISFPEVPAEAEMIILLFLHGWVGQTRLQYVRQNQQSYETLNSVDNTFQHSKLIR